jgi:signal peptidase I
MSSVIGGGRVPAAAAPTSHVATHAARHGWRARTRVGWTVTRQVALTVGAVVGLACIASGLAAVVLGIRPLVVESGSMSPTIAAGSVAFAHPADAAELSVGDVVSVETDTGGRVMHRITALAPEDAGAADDRPVVDLTLRGDANPIPDEERYRVASADRVLFSVPMVGYAVVWMRSPLGMLAVVALVVVALTTLRRPGVRRVGGATAAVAIAALGLAAAGPMAVRGTSAHFTDTASADARIGAATIAPPVGLTCTSDLLAATIAWPADPGLDYEVALRRISTGEVVSTREVTGADSSVVYAGTTDFGDVVGDGTVGFDVEVTSRLARAAAWRSSVARTYSAIHVVAVDDGATVTCA